MLENVPGKLRGDFMLEKVPGELLRKLDVGKSAWRAALKIAEKVTRQSALSRTQASS